MLAPFDQSERGAARAAEATMRYRERTKRKILSALTTAMGMMVLGALYALVFARGELDHVLIGSTIGFVVGGISSVVEQVLFQSRGRRWRFWVLLAVRSMFYVVLIMGAVLCVVALHLTMSEPYTWGDVFQSPRFYGFAFGGEFARIVLYGLVGALVVNFMRQVNVLLGQNALLYFFTAKYHNPIEERRIFMFLDLKSSTQIAEKLGHLTYHRFLNDFFHDITPAILESRGEIYQYVGDEVVVTWPERAGLKDANCISCFFGARAAIDLLRIRYEKAYGIVPQFKAGYHVGAVTAAEMGEVRKQIVYHGDTVNTAARIRSECTQLERDLLLSAPLVGKLHLEDLLTVDSVGYIRLSGKAAPMELYAVREAA
jgi:adenylate cyclase